MKIEIEKGIPPVNPNGKKGRKRIFPYDQMNVGDSFKIDVSTKEERRKLAFNLSTTSKYYSVKDGTGKKFTVSSFDTYVRIWRIK